MVRRVNGRGRNINIQSSRTITRSTTDSIEHDEAHDVKIIRIKVKSNADRERIDRDEYIDDESVKSIKKSDDDDYCDNDYIPSYYPRIRWDPSVQDNEHMSKKVSNSE